MRRQFIPRGCEAQGRLKPTIPLPPSLPDLLLAKGSMEGPYRRCHSVTRWSRAAQRFTRALLQFLLAPRCNLKD